MSDDKRTTGIACPDCGTTANTVTDSRARALHSYIRRRRKCLGCSKRFSTHERVIGEGAGTFLLTESGRLIPFNLDVDIVAEKVGSELSRTAAEVLRAYLIEVLR